MVGQKFRTRCFLDIAIDGDPVGRIVLELFNESCPKAAENFKKLCQGGCGFGLKTGKPLSYQGSIFHRVIKGFMVQGGDFSNKDGTGGESIYGGTFADECLTTPHDRPFLLSMANRGPNTNGSQFFITTAAAPHLNGKHVVFGHVLSGEDVVRRIEGVPIADTKAHRPVKPITIEACGELVPVKKKKTNLGEKEEKRKKKKLKKEKRKKCKPGIDENSDESENDVSCSVRPEEIPEVPAPKFLFRGKMETDSKRSDCAQNDQKHIAEAVGREIMRATRERHNDKSGRKIKGRGRMCYRSPASRSGSRDRSVTPPHWRQASQNIQKMDENDWKRWHMQRNSQRAQESRHELLPSQCPNPCPSEVDHHRAASLSPVVSSARNRSPSGSPSMEPSESPINTVSHTQPLVHQKRSPLSRRYQDEHALPSPKKPRPIENDNSSSPASRRKSTFDDTRELKTCHVTPVMNRQPLASPKEEKANELTYARENTFSKPFPAKQRTLYEETDEGECRQFSRSSRGGRETFPEGIPGKTNGTMSRSPTVSAPKPSISPIRRSPLKNVESPIPRVAPRSPELSLFTGQPQHAAVISPHSESSEIRYARGRLNASSPPSRRSVASPASRKAQPSLSPVHLREPPQASPPLRNTRPSVSPKSPIVQRRSRKDSVEIESAGKHSSRSPVFHSIPTDEHAFSRRKLTPPGSGEKEARRTSRPTTSPVQTKPPDTFSESHSSSSEEPNRSRSRSRSTEKLRRRKAPRSPPAHLLQKWRMRHEKLIQKRRIAPSVSSAFHTPSLSSEDRSRYIDRRPVALSSHPSHSRSRSNSCSPPRRRKQRSSTSHSRSGSSSHRPRRHVVSLQHDTSSRAISAESRSSSSEAKHSDQSQPCSPSSKLRVRHQATSPVNLPKKQSKINAITKTAVPDNQAVEDTSERSRWEKVEEASESESAQHSSWTTSHWQTAPEQLKSVNSSTSLVTQTRKPEIATSGSVLQRLRMAEVSRPDKQPSSTFDSPLSEGQTDETTDDPIRNDTVSQFVVQDSLSTVAPATVAENAITQPSKSLPSSERPTEQRAKIATVRQRSTSSSGSVDSSASSSSSESCSTHSSCSRSRTGVRRSISPFSRRRSDFSDSRSRGRSSYYGRYSPISRSRYSRSRSPSTYRSTIRSTYSSVRTRRRSSSRSRSRSYSRDSRSPSSRWAGHSSRYSSSRHRRGRRSRRYSGFRRPSSSRSRSSTRSYSSSPRRR